MFEQAPVGIAVLAGARHVYEACNARYRRFLGDQAKLGDPVADSLPEKAAQGFVELIDRAYASGVPAAVVERRALFDRDQDGTLEEYYVSVIAQPLSGENRSVYAVAVYATDVTALVRARDRAERRVHAANAADRAKSDLLTAVSHEVRNTLNALVGFSELLEMTLASTLAPQHRTYLETVRRSGERLVRLSSDLLDFARLELGDVEVAQVSGSTAEVMRESCELAASTALKKDVTLARSDPGESAETFVGDPDRVEQVLVNLLLNAIEASPARGTVALSARREDPPPSSRLDPGRPCTVFRVIDKGHGIAPERTASIFEAMPRANATSRGMAGGVGLGLAISRRVARRMGGDLVLERSVEGQGSTFALWLPSQHEASRAERDESKQSEARLPTVWNAVARRVEDPYAFAAQFLEENGTAVIQVFAARARRDSELWRAAMLQPSHLESLHTVLLSEIAWGLAAVAERSQAEDGFIDELRARRVAVAELHGRLRRQDRWTGPEIAREYALLGEAVESLQQHDAPDDSHPTRASNVGLAAMGLIAHLIRDTRAAALHAWREDPAEVLR